MLEGIDLAATVRFRILIDDNCVQYIFLHLPPLYIAQVRGSDIALVADLLSLGQVATSDRLERHPYRVGNLFVFKLLNRRLVAL